MIWWIFVLLMLGLGVAAEVYSRGARKRESHLVVMGPASGGRSTFDDAHADLRDWPEAVATWISHARRARKSGHIDNARAAYQKAAYGFAALTPVQNETLKQEIAGFVREDPRYMAGLGAIVAAIGERPGVLQSELGRASGSNREALNYVLYYAAFTGDIVRVKKGSSYRLFLPGQPIPEDAPKPKAKTKSKRIGQASQEVK